MILVETHENYSILQGRSPDLLDIISRQIPFYLLLFRIRIFRVLYLYFLELNIQQKSKKMSRRSSHPVGYVLEFAPHARHRHRIDTVDQAQSEMAQSQSDCPGMEKLLVLRGPVDVKIWDELRAQSKRGIWWRYPEPRPDGNGVLFRRVGFWTTRVSVLSVENGLGGGNRRTPKLWHQDAATTGGFSRNKPTSEQQDYEYTDDDYLTGNSLDDSLWDEIMEICGISGLRDVLRNLVYHRWTRYLASVAFGDENVDRAVLCEGLMCIEENIDAERKIQLGNDDNLWHNLLNRLHLRAQLVPSAPQQQRTIAGYHTDDAVLDRIAYLGGILLPISTVAGILAIEGRYGPEGTDFWVFWATSAVAAIGALLIMYMDRLRLVDVWVEADDEQDGMVRQRLTDVWRKERLGWIGALKIVSGYYRVRGTGKMRFRRPGEGVFVTGDILRC